MNCPRGDLALSCCPRCGHIFNRAFDPDRMSYSQSYDNSLHYSPTFQRYTHGLARHLVKRHDLCDKQLIEIGCGKGDFLLLLARLGGNRAIGFDPSYEPDRVDAPHLERVTFVQDYYTDAYAHYDADFVCSRYVLEHLPDPLDFLKMVHRALDPPSGTVLYFEVPNAALILRELSVWDVIYEHCSYFSPPSLAWVFEEAGFQVEDIYTGYNNQFLSIEARHVEGAPRPSRWAARSAVQALREHTVTLSDTLREMRASWRDRLAAARAQGQRVAAWGAGAKAVSFLNVVGAGEEVAAVVDINPHKQGAFLPGTGHPIIPPRQLVDIRPDLIILMNPIYKNEVRAMLHDFDLAPEIVAAF